MDEGTERDVVRRCKSGDWDAFDTIVEEHQEKVYCLALRLTGNHADADIVTQDVFIEAYKCLPTFAFRSRLMTWLYAITVRRVGKLERIRRGRPQTANIFDKSDTDRDGRRAATREPLEILEDRESGEQIMESVENLPLKLRAAFLLVAKEGLSHREAARSLKCSKKAIAWRVWDARRRLRIALAAYIEAE